MSQKLHPAEKRRIKAERERIEHAAFPNVEIEVIVEDHTYANGEPIIRILNRGVKDKPA